MKRFFPAILFMLFFLPFFSQAASVPSLERLFYYTDTNNSYADLLAHAKQIDILAPQAYVFSATGTISGGISNRTLIAANENGIKLMPLMQSDQSNISANHALLTNISSQNALIASMITIAKQDNFYGWQLDLEHASSSDRALLTAFAQKMGIALHAQGLIFSIAVPGKISDNPNDYATTSWNEWDGAFDYSALAENADFLSIMAYDQPNSPGPVATLPWFEKVVAYATSTIPLNKLSIGIPFYGYEWVPGNTEITASHIYQYALNQVAEHTTQSILFNTIYGVDMMKYFIKSYGVKYNRVLWYENIKSFTLKYVAVKNSGAIGFSGWALGQEDERDWSLLPKDR